MRNFSIKSFKKEEKALSGAYLSIGIQFPLKAKITKNYKQSFHITRIYFAKAKLAVKAGLTAFKT